MIIVLLKAETRTYTKNRFGVSERQH